MATRSSTAVDVPASAEVAAARPPRQVLWTVLASLTVAAAFVATVARVLTGVDDAFRFSGDQSLTGLSVHEASTFERELGPYSRYGWSHPGPLWFYLLAPATRLLGGDDPALMAASVLLNGLLAVAVVLAVHRAGRPLLTLSVAAAVLAFVLRMPAEMFVDVWSPYALLMGTLLFLVLAARVHSGSWPALLAMLVSGSFLAQTHVGTAPLVALVGLTGGVSFVLARRAPRPTAEAGADAGAPRPRRTGWTVALGALLVVVWIPPLLEQLSSPLREGNLVRLADFFLGHEEPGGRPTPPQALIAVGRLLAMTPYDWGPGPWEMDVSTLPAPVALALVAQGLAAVALVVLGRRWGSAAGTWWGAVLCAAFLAAVVSAATVTGVLYWYLLIWVAVLPVATAIGALHLASDRLAADRPAPDRDRTGGRRLVLDRAPVLLPVAAVAVVLSVLTAVSLGDAAEELPTSYGVTEASVLVDDGLATVDGRAVHVDIATPAVWPAVAGVVDQLVDQGYEVTVDRGSEELFGADRVGPGDEPVALLFAATGSPEHERALRQDGVTDLGSAPTEWGPTSVLLRVAG